MLKTLEAWNTKAGRTVRVVVRDEAGRFLGVTNKATAFGLEVWDTASGPKVKVTAREGGKFLGATNVALS